MIWDELSLPWRTSLEESWTAYCAGSIPIGSVITDQSGRVLARGRNRISEQSAEAPYLHGHLLAHAEMNALVALGNPDGSPWDLVLYTMVEPCPLCAGAIKMAMIGEIRYAARDPLAGSLELFDASWFMRHRQPRIVPPERDDLETVVMAMNVEFELRALESTTEQRFPLLETWRPIVPHAVDLGERLYRSGALRDLCRQRASVARAMEYLASEV